MIDIKVPPVGESISEVTLIKWVKEDGSYVERDEVIAELESEKATFEVNAEQAGALHHVAQLDDTLNIGDVLAKIDETVKPTVVTTKADPTIASVTKGKGVIEVKVPTVGESISEVTLLKWLKEDGALVNRDEPIAELESEKATFELNAEESGQLRLLVKEEDVLQIGQLAATIDTDVVVAHVPQQTTQEPVAKCEEKVVTPGSTEVKASPVANAMIADKKMNIADIKASGVGGKIMKNDVLNALANPGRHTLNGANLYSREERHEKMSNLRKTISRRLVESKNTTAMLTTFNEVNMTHIMDIRQQYKDKFKEIHGVGLGFMSFFAKACAIALGEFPAVNAYIDGNEIIYHDYADISIAVSTPRGLSVPVMRNVESMSMAEIEKKVVDLAVKARDSKLTMEELQGGTFTITNGGVFGSLLSTPIINLPQSAILGMHKIQDRPIAENGQVVIRPMMYIALSYDHRIIDGKESVSFLVRVKQLLENPSLLLFREDPIKTLLEL